MKWPPTKEDIDKAVAEHDIFSLTYFMRAEFLPSEVRLHLADTVSRLLSKEMSFPPGRPKKDGHRERHWIAVRVWEILRSGWTTKVESAIARVSQERRAAGKKPWSIRHIYTCWGEADLTAFDFTYEKRRLDEMLDAAYTAADAAATEHLTEIHGSREFTEEEISNAVDELAATAWANFEADCK